jgi:NAD(P)-dependent dehydrogenase (short-subunit alcohol dehydrogenase family)
VADRYLDGRHAIVTGGNRGIGRATADALAARGAALTITGRDLDSLRNAAHDIAAAHSVEVLPLACDVTDERSVITAFGQARGQLGDPYILVNNAGQSEGRPFLETGRDLWDRMIAVNLTGAYLCTQEVLADMLNAGTGRIINVASTSGLKGYRNITAYCASKHGLVGLTRALAAETARAGVTVNAVCPAYTDTDMTARAVDTVARDMSRSELQSRALIERTIRRGTLIQPLEVASLVAWLCSPDATGVSGQALVVAAGEI